MLIELKEKKRQIYNPIVVGDFSTSFSEFEEEAQKIPENINLNNTINELDLIDIDRALH